MSTQRTLNEATIGGFPFFILPEYISRETKARFAARYGPEAGCDRAAAGDRGIAVLLLPELGRDELIPALCEPACAVIEWPEGECAWDWLAVPVAAEGLFLSLTTATAFALQSAVAICEILTERGVLAPERRSQVELCVHEAIANAIVHGNLGIVGMDTDDAEGYRQFSQLIKDRLADARRRRLRIEIFVRWTAACLEISVADQGAGFDVSAVPAEADGNAASGRGFVFMRTLADDVQVSDGGRCTSLRFER
ncbi:MAG: ATP-binding protein [Azospirillum sp.]|nr:ATP-binding protein [Azospirillum sp.]